MSTDTMNPPRTMLEVYQSLQEGTPMQLIKNELIMSPSPLTIHQRIAGKLFTALQNYLENRDIGEVFISPYDVHLDDENIYQPDILFVAKENLNKIKENGFYGAPDLVIEILSPGTAQPACRADRYDRIEKKEIYERYGVKEYWIVDPKTNVAEGFWLQNGKFEPLAKEKQKLKLKVLDTVLKF